MRLLIFITLLVCCNSTNTIGQQVAQNQKGAYTVPFEYDYLLFTPTNKVHQNKSGKLPLIVFLHGAGERGTDIQKVKVHGPPKLAEQNADFPFMVLSPQCPENQRWDARALSELLDHIIANHQVDRSRIYLTGLSMGGQGTYDLAILRPNTFAAIAPICGGDYMHAYSASIIKELPIWVFHGAMDEVVPLDNSVRIVKALKNLKADVQFTIYPMAGHDSWTETYLNEKLYTWFLSCKKK